MEVTYGTLGQRENYIWNFGGENRVDLEELNWEDVEWIRSDLG
jgi:hypothetical protein